MKILCVQTANLGDVVSSTAVINILRDKYGGVDVVVRPGFEGVFDGEKKIFVISESEALNRDYDLAVDLDSSSHSRKLFKKIKAGKKLGRYSGLLGKLKHRLIYSDHVPKNPKGHIVREYYPILESLGFSEKPEPKLSKTIEPNVDAYLHQINPENKRLAVIHFSARNSIRNLPDDLVAQVTTHLQKLGYNVLFIGSEKNLIEKMVARCPGTHHREFSMDQLKAVLSRANLFVGSDSGPMHMAAALGCRGVGIYGPALAETVAPLSHAIKKIEKDFPCRPCNQNRPCPYNKRCLNTVTFDDVISQI